MTYSGLNCLFSACAGGRGNSVKRAQGMETERDWLKGVGIRFEPKKGKRETIRKSVGGGE